MCDLVAVSLVFLFNDYTLLSAYFTVAERFYFQGKISFSDVVCV